MFEFLIQNFWCIPFYGLIGSILTLPWSIGIIKRTGPRPAAYFNLLMTFLALVHGSIVYQAVWNQEPQEIIFNWLETGDLNLSFAFNISSVSIGAMTVVTSLTFLAQIYALGYLEKDWALARFFGLMGFFEAAMSGLTISDSLFISYALLEMLTLSTYLIVGFWYAQPLVVTAARDAFLTKRVGDVLLLMGVVAISALAGSMNFSDLYLWAERVELNPITANLLGLALIAGPIGKCAQFPLHLWLDEAMEGPNPASILRNTIVVAIGAYVLIQIQPILIISPIALAVLVAVGTVTAIGASLVALAQIDLKRALSHSTSAYLGLVFIAVGTQWTSFGLVLLLAHCIAKALLFMSAGGVILTTNSQDLTEMGGLGSKMPATTTSFLVGTLGLIGLLPLGGFWALREGLDAFWIIDPWVVPVILLVNFLTALNLTRVFRLIFLGEPQPKTRRAPEVPWTMAVPMVSLIIVTLLAPVIMESLSLLPDWNYLNVAVVILLIGSGLLGVVIGSTMQLGRTWSRPIQAPFRLAQDLFAYDFYVDRLYNVTIVFAVSQFSKLSAWIDRYIVDGIVNLVGLATIFSGQGLKYGVSGQGQSYLLTILLGIGVLGYLVLWLIDFTF
ncbi:NAD(P)H-quinone oxidoreductase subunit F [Okeania sp.]|uniref:NAD(P)H-quinone oxidoreductase subunit F n=1 Tax=Okeania sp. TaxID=3100323 RepID=UPI002B4AFE9F|nr:NAD(P)H-quinone oxidoreductase subunit F [Okeania sp.]MEB3340016.1 NAD(P)H-quinone oxidoreductase subunit F [Okeania sp.]